jgi:hypothetical protein
MSQYPLPRLHGQQQYDRNQSLAYFTGHPPSFPPLSMSSMSFQDEHRSAVFPVNAVESAYSSGVYCILGIRRYLNVLAAIFNGLEASSEEPAGFNFGFVNTETHEKNTRTSIHALNADIRAFSLLPFLCIESFNRTPQDNISDLPIFDLSMYDLVRSCSVS